MEFFKKNGRPTEEEKMILDAIGNMIEEKGLSVSDVPECYNLDDLMIAVELLETIEVQRQSESEIETGIEVEQMEEPEQIEEENKLLSDETLTSITEEEQPNEQLETQLLEEMEASENGLPNFEDSEYDPFAEPIIERSYNKQNGNEQKGEQLETEELNLDESSDTPLSDLNPRTKQRAAEQTADAILKGYKNFAPEPFKWWCKFSESQIERMTFEGEIDPNIEVEKDVTFDEYIKQTNGQIDEIFEVQEETLEEIKEPLVEVLLEQELELTPQQRLGMAVLSHLIQMFTMAMKLWGQNKRILEYQKHLTQLAYQARAKAA